MKLIEILETATAGAVSAGSIAGAVGGFSNEYWRSIYWHGDEKNRKKKKVAKKTVTPKVISRLNQG